MSGYQGNIIIKNPATPTGPAQNGSAPGVWTLSEALAFKRQGVWPTQGVTPADPYFNYVSMLLSTTALGNANNNLFVDSSGAFSPISRLGNTTQGSMTPYSANWSNYFDGDGDNLTLPSSASYAIASSSTPFTVEAWIYPTAGGGCVFSEAYPGSGSIPIVISMSTGSSVDGLGGLYIGFGWYTGAVWVTAAIASSAVTANTWTHIACVFTGSTTKIYYNGVDVTKPSSPTPASSWGVTGVAGDSWYIGRRWDAAGSNWFSGYISNLRFVNGTAVYTANFTPPTAPLTAIANTVLLTCQSNRFRDASTVNAAITLVGNTRVTDFSPFLSSTLSGITYDQSDITNWSGYFDGSGDYLSAANNAAFQFGTGDFTVECWINKPAAANGSVVDVRSGGTGAVPWAFYVDGSNFPYFYDGTSYTSSVAITTNAWNHIAVVRTSGTLKIFVNGVEGYSQAHSVSLNATGSLLIGGTAAYTTGYISNLRIVKGTAVYTSAFTPPTTNLTAISGTSLLTLQNAAFTDNSTNNFIITPNGNITVTGNSPFNTVGYWSNYFDGSTSRMSVPDNAAFGFGTGNFTVEFWLNYTGGNGYKFFFINYSAGGNYVGYGLQTGTLTPWVWNNGDVLVASSNITPNTWQHHALVRNGSTLTIYLNGTAIGSTTWATDLGASRPFFVGWNSIDNTQTTQGYISNMRVVKGAAVYTGNFTPPTAPLTAISNTSLLTCQNGRFIDNSTNNFAVTVSGTTSVQSFDPFYTATIASNGGSMYFDGTGDYLTNPPNPNWIFAGDYTLEAWVYPFSTGFSHIFGTGGSGSNDQFGFSAGNGNATIYWAFNAVGNYLTQTATIPTNAWTHIVVSRSSGTLKAFINGSQVFSGTMTTTVGQNATNYIGMRSDGFNLMNGYIAGLNITNGTARYTAAFTPPTAPANPIATTVLMGNGMNAGIYDAAAINDIETVGNAQVRFPTPFAPANYYAAYFDGSGDYLGVPTNAALSFGTGDFTIEAWIYPTGGSANRHVFSGGQNDAVAFALNSSGQIVIAKSGVLVIAAGTTVIPQNQFTHVAVSRSGDTFRIFVNGTLETTVTSAQNFTTSNDNRIGFENGSNYYQGYISNLRVIKGSAIYTSSFTPSTTPLTAISGTSLLTCQNKTFIDNSTNAFTITAFGNATAGAIGPFTSTGGTSVYFDGSSRLTMPPTADMDLSTGDFTVEAWVYSNTLSGTGSAATRAAAGNITSATELQWGIYRSGSSMIVRPYQGSTDFSINVGTIAANTWYHVAMTRSGNTFRGFLNGVLAGTTQTISGALNNNTGWFGVLIGGITVSGGSEYWNGYIDDLRITKGYARYTSTFTPPTQPFVTY